MNINTVNVAAMNKPEKGKVHVFLENLIQQKFGVFLEVQHKQFEGNSVTSGKPIRARTTVMAFSTKEDAKNFKTNNKIPFVSCAHSECSIHDNFSKKVGLTKALHRLYRNLAVMHKKS